MWWSDQAAIRLPLLLAVLAGLGLSACGFQRQYAVRDDTDTSPVRQEMSRIDIEPIPERTGQILRNDLLTVLTPMGEPDRPAYRLEVKLTERLDGMTVSKQKTTTRYNYWLNATFRLRDVRTEKVLMSDKARAVIGFNVVSSEFATTVASEDAARQAADLVGAEIEGRLAAYLGQRTAGR